MMTTSNDVNDDSNSDVNDANDKDGSNGDNNDGEVERDGGDNDCNNLDNDDVNVDVVKDDINVGTTTMRWRRGRMDDDDAMAMGGQSEQNTRERRTNHPRQQSTYVDSLGRSRRERGTISGEGTTEKGRGGGD